MPSTKSLSDIIPDAKNLNLGTDKGAEAIQTSLEENGFGRSMLMSKDGVMIGGNQVLKNAKKLGMGDIEPIYVESDGTRPVVVVRTDIESETPEFLRLAVADNLTQQKSLHWREDARDIIEAAGMTVEEVGFTDDDLRMIETGEAPGSNESPGGENTPTINQSISVVVECKDEDDAQGLYERLTGEGRKVRVLTI